MPQDRFKKETLLEDERGRNMAAVLRYGPYLFLSSSDGHRDIVTERVVPELDGQAVPQCNNAYGRQALRLQKAGYRGDDAIWIENFTSGQSWRLERMATWPDHFGEVGHAQAVSFGAQVKMAGVNMLTAVVQALTPDIEREVIVPQPARGRASRITRAGDFTYVIGVRGRTDPFTEAEAPEEVPEQLDAEHHNTYEWLRSHIETGGGSLDDFVRTDCALLRIGDAPHYRAGLKRRFGTKVPFAAYAVGTLLGGRGVMEVGGIAVNPGGTKEVAWLAEDPGEAQAVRANGLVFCSGASGLADERTGAVKQELYGDQLGQTKQAFRRLEAGLNRFDSSLDRVLRLDVFLDDIYFEDAFIEAAREFFGASPPTMNIVGVDLEHNAEVELTAIAGA
ncbi:MAG: RidA family protein [Chloroflexi bacterium]|nr:RidA family protein [Chloroflexota bacterium]